MLACKVRTNAYYLRRSWIMTLWLEKYAISFFHLFCVSAQLSKLLVRLIKTMYLLWVFSIFEFRLDEICFDLSCRFC